MSIGMEEDGPDPASRGRHIQRETFCVPMTSAMASVSPFKQSIHASRGKKNKILIQSGPFTRYRWLFFFFKKTNRSKKTKINFVSKSNSKQKLKLADGLVQYYCSVSCGSGMICSEVVMWMPQKKRGGHLTWAKSAFSAAEHWKSLEMMLKKIKGDANIMRFWSILCDFKNKWKQKVFCFFFLWNETRTEELLG